MLFDAVARPIRILLPMLIAIAGQLIGCAGAPPTASERILGLWTGIDSRNITQTFEFRADGSVSWDLVGPNFSGTFELRYIIQNEPAPHPFDLGIFEEGPLTGRSLFGIVEFSSDDAFRLDVEPGPDGAAPGDPAGDAARASEFSDQAITYTRQSRTIGGDDVARGEIDGAER